LGRACCISAGGLEWLPQSKIFTDEEFIRLIQAAAMLGLNKIRLTSR
jgi:molybdenum cofactor biosynthesis enzyme MoaA